MELLIVVAIVGTISAVALPQFLSARVAAEATTSIAEVLSLASQCAIANKSGIQATITDPTDGSELSCTGLTVSRIDSRPWSGDAAGVRCLDVVAGSGHRSVRMIVREDGEMICRFR